MSGPAKAAASAVSALNDQVQALKSSLDSVGKFSFKIPTAIAAPAKQAKQASEPLGAMFGPGRKEAEASAKYALSEKKKLDSASASLDKQRSAAQYSDFQKQERERARAAAEAEKLSVGYHIKQIQRAQAEEKARKRAELALGVNRHEALDTLAHSAGAGGIAGRIGSLKQIGAAFEEVTGLSASAGLAIAGVASAILVAGGAAYELGKGVLSVTKELAEATLEGTIFAQNMRLAFGFLVHDAKLGADTFEVVRKEAQSLGLDVHETVDSFRSLLAAQFSIEQSHGLVKMAADMQAIGASGEEVQRILYAMREIKDLGGLQRRQLRQLEMAGISGSLINEQLQIELKMKNPHAVEKAMKGGKIDADKAIRAIENAVKEKLGETNLGDTAAKMADMTISGSLRVAKAKITNFFTTIGERVEPAAMRFVRGLSGITNVIDETLPSGKALQDVLTGAFNAILKVAQPVGEYLEIFFLGLELAALKVYNALRPIAAQLGLSFGDDNQDSVNAFELAMLSFAEAVGKVAHGVAILASYNVVWDALSGAATVIEIAAGAAWELLQPILAVPEAIFDFGAAFLLAVDWLSKFGTEAERSGENLVTGLINGIEAAASRLYDTVVAMATTALDKFKGVFGIHSPSRVMAQMGGHMTEGLAIGISSGARQQTGAMVGAGAQLSLGAAAGAQLGMLSHIPRALAMNDNALGSRGIDSVRAREPSSGSGGTVINFHAEPGSFPITGIHGVEDLKSMMPEILADAFEQAALMNGTA